jgi:hypothetical protein
MQESEMQASLISFCSAHSRDHFDANFVVLTACSSIRASKKRKLHELYCVAAQVGALPLVDTTGDGAHPTTEEEARFLGDNAVLQYVLSTPDF